MPEAKNEAMMETADFLMNALRTFVHRSDDPKFGPHMQDVIRLGGIGADFVEVVVPTTYAQEENARPGDKPGYGPHNFADMAQEQTEQMAPDIWFTKYSELFGVL